MNRYLKSPPYLKKNDIISSPEFSEANECYKTAMAEIKAAGKGDITHYPEIESEDLTKLYNNIFRHFTILRHMPRNVFSVHFPTIFS
jgi:hypothetical protein